jgi:hypothetical protein
VAAQRVVGRKQCGFGGDQCRSRLLRCRGARYFARASHGERSKSSASEPRVQSTVIKTCTKTRSTGNEYRSRKHFIIQMIHATRSKKWSLDDV